MSHIASHVCPRGRDHPPVGVRRGSGPPPVSVRVSLQVLHLY